MFPIPGQTADQMGWFFFVVVWGWLTLKNLKKSLRMIGFKLNLYKGGGEGGLY